MPHSWANERDPEEVFIERQSYFQHLANHFAESSSWLHMGAGDTNTRLHGRLNGEEDVLGSHIFGSGSDVVELMPHNDQEHQNIVVNCLKDTDHSYANTFFQKTTERK